MDDIDYPEIDHRGQDLVYVVVADHLQEQIELGRLPRQELPPGKGRLPVGARLPSGPELAALYGVAPMTARRAVVLLRERGLVRTVTGKGTFVLPPQE